MFITNVALFISMTCERLSFNFASNCFQGVRKVSPVTDVTKLPVEINAKTFLATTVENAILMIRTDLIATVDHFIKVSN